MNKSLSLEDKFDSVIRVFLYILMFWIPYSLAVIETCVIISFFLFLAKRVAAAIKNKMYLRWSRGLKVFKPLDNPLNQPIALFLFICFLSVFHSSAFNNSLYHFFTKIFEWFVIFFLALEVFKEKKHIYMAIGILFFTATATALDSFYQFYISNKDIFLGHTIVAGGRPTAGFKTANDLAGYWTIVAPLSLIFVFMKGKKTWYYLIALTVFSLILWSLVLTLSRGAWLGVVLGVVAIAFIFLYLKRRFQDRSSRDVCLILLFLCVILFFAFKISFSVEASNRSVTGDWRLTIWQDSLKMIHDKPFLGHGINTYMDVFQKDYRRRVVWDSRYIDQPTYAHNCYIQLAAETGILGLSAFLWIFFRFFGQAFKRIRDLFQADPNTAMLLIGSVSGTVAFLVHGFFDTNFYNLQLSAFWWLIMGLQVAIVRLTLANKENIG